MKTKILTLLRERKDYVSGQELCESFGVSRTAVWKAVSTLKEEGYQIEAVKNRGYILIEGALQQDFFNQNEIESRMTTKIMGHPTFFYKTIDSTNLKAKQFAEEGKPSGTLIVADKQTAGRGRRGRGWESPEDKNVYFTLMLKPTFSPDKASQLTLIMALAVATAIKELPEAGIKWPNDIVVNGRKICGILTEMSAEPDFIHHVVIGVGINVFAQEFPEEIKNVASDIETASGIRLDRSKLVVDIMQAFENYYELFCQTEDLSKLREIYENLLVNKGKEVRVLDPRGEYNAIAKGINEQGELIVCTPDGEEKNVYAGEVSVRGILGYV